MPSLQPVRAVTWDYGQTLASLDTDYLAQRLRELEWSAEPEALEQALPGAWDAYNSAVRKPGTHAWKIFMRTLLMPCVGRTEGLDDVVESLWQAQPQRNLWRRPIPGMINIVDDLRAANIAVGIVSNSEGRLEELLTELGWRDRFLAVADSGRLGLEKPDQRIFVWACDRLGVTPAESVHVGDSRAADVEGALGAGMRSIWFGRSEGEVEERVRSCANAEQVRHALFDWGVLLRSSPG